ncbi:MAG TPA: DUF952 domain-containing protein [bacterium]|nr:DUF952 domain-containing protein [bacterium]
MHVIFHLVSRDDWAQAQAQGEYRPASLATDGFIHCSTRAQVVDTAGHFFRGRTDLLLLCIDERRTSAPVKYEPPAGPAPHDPAIEPLFPHLYGPLNLDAVLAVYDFPPSPDGAFQLPQLLQ